MCFLILSSQFRRVMDENLKLSEFSRSKMTEHGFNPPYVAFRRKTWRAFSRPPSEIRLIIIAACEGWVRRLCRPPRAWAADNWKSLQADRIKSTVWIRRCVNCQILRETSCYCRLRCFFVVFLQILFWYSPESYPIKILTILHLNI